MSKLPTKFKINFCLMTKRFYSSFHEQSKQHHLSEILMRLIISFIVELLLEQPELSVDFLARFIQHYLTDYCVTLFTNPNYDLLDQESSCKNQASLYQFLATYYLIDPMTVA